MTNRCFERIEALQRQRGTVLCVGLDPEPGRIDGPVDAWLAAIIDATQDLVCAYKPNLAFFEQLGLDGWSILDRVLRPLRGEVPIIVDSKRGDVGHTSEAYARSLFDVLGADAVTVNPYAGWDAVAPYQAWPDRGVFVLARMSNQSAADLQDRVLDDGRTVHDLVLEWCQEHTTGSIGAVLGATAPETLLGARQRYPDLPLLVPGIGDQGGSVEAVLQAAAAGRAPLIVSQSRSILYAGSPTLAREAVLAFNSRCAEVTG